MSRDLKYTRNIGIAAHIDAGKTTTTERILYYTGVSHKMVKFTTELLPWIGWSKNKSVELPSPLLQPHVSGLSYRTRKPIDGARGYHFNIIDTPGHVDFTVEVNRSLEF